MMKQWHWSATATPAVTSGGLVAAAGAPVWVGICCALLIFKACTWNDLAHPRFKGKLHPGAALVRKTGQLGYLIQTEKDQNRTDVHLGLSHCVEWCLLAGAAVAGLSLLIPFAAPYALYWGCAVFLGTFGHMLLDWMTPSGVPLCATYNYFRHGEVWKRHTLNWFSTNSGAEHFGAVPALYLLALTVFLAMVGWLDPILSWLVGGLL